MTPHDRLARLTTEHARSRQRVAREEIGDLDPERRGDALERRDAAVRAPALELADEALAHAGGVRDLLQRPPPQEPDRPEPLADRHFRCLNRSFTQVKRAYAGRPGKPIGGVGGPL